MRHIRNLISAIILYDKEGLSTLSLSFFEDKNTFYSDTQIVDNGKMFAKVIELNSKDLRSAFDEWHKNFYMKFVNWGTSKQRPINFTDKTEKECKNFYNEEAEKEYNDLIRKLE